MQVARVEAPKGLDPRQWADPVWRLNNLYWCVDEKGEVFKFRLNETQERFIRDYWYLNVILKARQLGFTTLIDLLALDQCIFVPNFTAGIIAHNLEAASSIFRNKVKFPWDRLPEQIREWNPLVKETASELVWANGSSIGVSVSMRSGTINFLHVSEFGKIARLYPQKAKEIRLGSFNAVHAGNFIFVESTAEGRGGDFYDLVEDAKDLRDRKAALTPLDWKLHFYPWWKDRRYVLDPRGVVITPYLTTYFAKLAKMRTPTYPRGIQLTEAQRAWYAKKARSLKSDTKERHADMKQEFPSYEEEAFEAANEEKYFGRQLTEARQAGRILSFEPVKKRTNQYWDIGLDSIAVWFHQYAALQHRFIHYYQRGDATVEEVLEDLQDLPFLHGTIYLPHDAKDRHVVTKTSAYDVIREKLPNVPVIVVPRPERVINMVNAGRNVLPECWFRAGATDEGVKHLEMFRKKWDEALGVWKDDEYVHDIHSHGATAWCQFAQGWQPQHEYLGGQAPAMGSTIGDKRAGY